MSTQRSDEHTTGTTAGRDVGPAAVSRLGLGPSLLLAPGLLAA